MTFKSDLEAKLEYLKACQRENFKREPNHPRNKFDYAVVVPNHPLGYHEHYCMDLEVAKQSAREWSKEYGRVQVEDKNLNTVYAIFNYATNQSHNRRASITYKTFKSS